MKNKNIHTFIGCDAEYNDSNIVIFGAPFDGTTSYRPGTRFASSTMRSESFGLETYSPYQNKDLTDMSIFDGGDLELPFGNTKRVLQKIKEYTIQILKNGKLPLMIGGEHLVTLGAVQGAIEKYPDLHLIHFDAHTDLREDYLGEKLSHATVIRRCHDIMGDGKIYQFGIRSGDRPEFYWAREHVTMCRFNFDTLDEAIEQLMGKPVYFTIDLDILDPAVFPGTGTPEAGGVTFVELLGAMERVCKLNVIGADINELCPVFDQSGSSTALACKVLRELLLYLS